MHPSKYFKKVLRHFEPRFNFINFLPTHGKVLDCGCGDFVSTNKLRECRADLQWFCTDICQAGTVPQDISFSLVNFEEDKLPYPDNYFDGIFVLHVMEHIANLELFCTELARVTKDGGHVYIEVPGILSMFAPTSSRFFSKTGNFFDDITHKRVFTIPSLRDLAQCYLKLQVIQIGTARNLIKILSIPALSIYSILKWRALVMTGICDLIGFRLYCIATKKR